MAILETIVIAFWAMLPAYVPNNAAVLAGGGRPIDGGRTWGDKRVLGDGKTWRGTAMGILAGLALAAVLTLVKPAASDALGFAVPEFTPLAASDSPAARCSGTSSRRSSNAEAAASAARCFGSRSTGFRRRLLPLVALLDFEWFSEWFTLEVILVVVVLTPILHVTTNMIAYKLGLKNEPW